MELFEAVSQNDVIQVMKLLENGIDPNQLDIDQHGTALHYAVETNAVDVVFLLITAGADIESVTQENLTVFDLARQHGHEDMLVLLVKMSHMRLSQNTRFYRN